MRPPLSLLLFVLLISSFPLIAPAQTRERVVAQAGGESIKVDVNLVVLDALVMQKKSGRVVGDLRAEDFQLSEDGVKQQITHFSQETLPLSVILLVDRGGCLDPFGERVRAATLAALERLRPADEAALLSFHDTVETVQTFTRDKTLVAEALDRVPEHEEQAEHCFNRALARAADYMIKAGNPSGRRVIIVITGLTSFFDCPGPSAASARHAVFESGSVVCGLIPSSPGQRLESGAMRVAAGLAGVFDKRILNLNKLAEETGGEVLSDRPEVLDQTFLTLVEHLRTRYSLGFVSSNKKRDGAFRQLKLQLGSSSRERAGDLVIKTRRGYLAPKG